MPNMGNIRHVLVANELASYRESIAAVLRYSFPDLEVFEANSAELNREVLRLRPELVICSKATALVRDRVPNWVELYPEHAGHSVASEGGRRTEFAEIQLLDLIGILDRAAGTDRGGPV